MSQVGDINQNILLVPLAPCSIVLYHILKTAAPSSVIAIVSSPCLPVPPPKILSSLIGIVCAACLVRAPDSDNDYAADRTKIFLSESKTRERIIKCLKVDFGMSSVTCTVRVYDCSLMAVNCGRCRATERRYSCGWCLHTQTCSVQQTCTPESWISRTQFCPDPVIMQVCWCVVATRIPYELGLMVCQ